MISITATWLSDQLSWDVETKPHQSDELTICFKFIGKLGKRMALSKLEGKIADHSLRWIKRNGKDWTINLEALKLAFPELKSEKLFTGLLPTEPEVEDAGGQTSTNYTIVSFIVSKKEMVMFQSRKIFLSHKGKDKKLARRFQRALEAIGHDIWLDEKNLKAGDHLERGILKGFQESCAAVFFITENFKDEKYLNSEIDYAIGQARDKENYFKIITLAFKPGKDKVEIPELLKSYVWKSPSSELDALTEIIKALPLAPKQFDFRS